MSISVFFLFEGRDGILWSMVQGKDSKHLNRMMEHMKHQDGCTAPEEPQGACPDELSFPTGLNPGQTLKMVLVWPHSHS